MDQPVVLKTKYAFHALLWLLEPEVVLDVGSMDGSDSKRFRRLLPDSDLVAFEGNPWNFRAMLDDPQIAGARIRVVNNLVSDSAGPRSFFVQRPLPDAGAFNRGVGAGGVAAARLDVRCATYTALTPGSRSRPS